MRLPNSRMHRAASMYCQTRCDGSKFKPSVRPGNASNSVRQTAGLDRQVLAARPFVVAEQHRAILDADLHSLALGVLHQSRPDRVEDRPLRLDRPRGVPADEGVHHAKAQDAFAPSITLPVLGDARRCSGSGDSGLG